MIRPISGVDSPFIWFPAAWMPLVVDALGEKSFMHSESTGQLGAVASLINHSLCYLTRLYDGILHDVFIQKTADGTMPPLFGEWSVYCLAPMEAD